jgi:hypothetical protein
MEFFNRWIESSAGSGGVSCWPVVLEEFGGKLQDARPSTRCASSKRSIAFHVGIAVPDPLLMVTCEGKCNRGSVADDSTLLIICQVMMRCWYQSLLTVTVYRYRCPGSVADDLSLLKCQVMMRCCKYQQSLWTANA